MESKEKQNYKNEKQDKPEKIPFIGSKTQAESEFKSPNWALSYEYPYNPDTLCSGNNYDIYDEMVVDDQIKSALSVKKDMVVNTGYKIVGERDDVNEFVTKNFEHINETTGLDSCFNDILRDMLSSYDYGFSMTEPVYKLENGKYVYKVLRTRAPHAFKFYLDKYGNVEKITQMTENEEKEFEPSTFIHHVYQSRFGNPYGTSDLQAAHNAWKAKKFFVKFFAIYVEKLASGTVVTKYPKNYTGSEITKLHDIVKSIQNATTLALPDDTVLDILEMKRDASDIYLKGIDYYNMQIARSILVPDLLGISGTATKGGSYALGKEQFRVFLGIIKKDRESLSRKITMKLVRPLVLANFGDIDCRFEFLPYKKEDVLEYLKLWVEAVRAQAVTPTEEDINYFRSVVGFPESENEGGNKPPKKTPPKKEAGKKTTVEDDDDDKGSYTSRYRELTKYEKKVDFEKIQKTLDSAESKMVSILNNLGADVYNSLIKQIDKSNALNKFKPEVINAIEAKNTKSMAIALRNYYTELYKKTTARTHAEMFPDRAKDYALDLMPVEFNELLKEEAFRQIDDYAINMTKKAKNNLIQSIKDGIGEKESLKLLRGELKDSSETWINTVIRTKTTEIFNEARKRYWENDPLAKQIVVAYQWSAILDARTSEICRYMDTKIFAVGELSDWLKPPSHMNCRSILVPITKFEQFEATPKNQLSIDKLKKKGGNLLKPSGGKKFSKGGSMVDLDDINNKLESIESMVSKYAGKTEAIPFTATEYGDNLIIESPGDKVKLKIKYIIASNVDPINPITIGFKGDKEDEVALKYVNTLPKAGGKFERDFGKSGWTLNAGEGFVINLSAAGRVECTIEYEEIG